MAGSHRPKSRFPSHRRGSGAGFPAGLLARRWPGGTFTHRTTLPNFMASSHGSFLSDQHCLVAPQQAPWRSFGVFSVCGGLGFALPDTGELEELKRGAVSFLRAKLPCFDCSRALPARARGARFPDALDPRHERNAA